MKPIRIDEDTLEWISVMIRELQERSGLDLSKRVWAPKDSETQDPTKLPDLQSAFGREVSELEEVLEEFVKDKNARLKLADTRLCVLEWLRSSSVLPILAQFSESIRDQDLFTLMNNAIGSSSRLKTAAKNIAKLALDGMNNEDQAEYGPHLCILFTRRLANKSRDVLVQIFGVDKAEPRTRICATVLLVAAKDLYRRVVPSETRGFLDPLLRANLGKTMSLGARLKWTKCFSLPRAVASSANKDVRPEPKKFEELDEDECIPAAAFGLGKWTDEERIALFVALKEWGHVDKQISWVHVAAHLAYRTAGDCKRQWEMELELASERKAGINRALESGVDREPTPSAADSSLVSYRQPSSNGNSSPDSQSAVTRGARLDETISKLQDEDSSLREELERAKSKIAKQEEKLKARKEEYKSKYKPKYKSKYKLKYKSEIETLKQKVEGAMAALNGEDQKVDRNGSAA